MILVIGASSTLGQYLQACLHKEKIPYVAPTSQQLDISSEVSIYNFFKTASKYQVIYLLAAETNVDLCEKKPHRAYSINAMGVKMIAQCAANYNIQIIYISTSAVFGGGVQKWRYCELDHPIPMNLYGASKLAGENFIKSICKRYCIVRSSWMVGGGPQFDKKFISKMIPSLKTDQDIYAVHDKFGSLTYAKHLAEFLVTAYKQSYQDIIHFSSIDYVNRYDIAIYIANLLGSKSKIIGVDSTTFPLSAHRSISEALYSVTSLELQTYSWQEIIKDYLGEWL